MRVGYFVGLFCMTAFAFVACEKAGEDGGNKELRLTVDCSDLVADGVDKVTFTVKYGEEDVTALPRYGMRRPARCSPEANSRRIRSGATSSWLRMTARNPIK